MNVKLGTVYRTFHHATIISATRCPCRRKTPKLPRVIAMLPFLTEINNYLIILIIIFLRNSTKIIFVVLLFLSKLVLEIRY